MFINWFGVEVVRPFFLETRMFLFIKNSFALQNFNYLSQGHAYLTVSRLRNQISSSFLFFVSSIYFFILSANLSH